MVRIILDDFESLKVKVMAYAIQKHHMYPRWKICVPKALDIEMYL